MTFVQRALDFTFQLGTGDFGAGGFDTVETPSGLWATAQILKKGTPDFNEAHVRIYGLSTTIMNKISRVGVLPTATRNNLITVKAGEAGGSMPIAFCGVIQEAWPDFSNPTEATLNVYALTGLYAQMKPVPPTSYAGTTDVATIMGPLAKQMGYTLETNNVSVQLSNQYLAGTARVQALRAAQNAGIYVVFDDDNGIMALVPKRGSRSGAAVEVSPQTGMRGYPSYIGPGKIALSCEYNPLLKFMGRVLVKNSIVSGANGTWRVTSLTHDLSTMPDGPWFSNIQGNNLLLDAF